MQPFPFLRIHKQKKSFKIVTECIIKICTEVTQSGILHFAVSESRNHVFPQFPYSK